ncbi:FitA-like ribbon-helix-helix domain-containing protein [Kineococcus sp. SYSU DK001]|uniref:FitA-like ribbon-helix-helix domain-containing protein n=1 Tax=Kineococcus sp. SYSU DK001 TaxID=3383122 RepID=UPI003D7C4711
MEQIVVRNLPTGTKGALKAQAQRHGRSLEAEVREILARSIAHEPATLVDVLSVDEGADVEFEAERLRLVPRTPEL